MNIVTLLQQHPLLCADLKNLGLSRRHMHNAAIEISQQLGGNQEFNLCYVLAALNSREFVRTIDAAPIATSLDISAALAQSIVLMIAPWVERFQLKAV